jgi:hypothetical protein
MAAFCSNCGAPATTGRFCAACGAASPAQPNPTPPQPQPQAFQPQPYQPQPFQPSPYQVRTASSGGGSIAKILMIIAAVIFVFGGLGVAGLVYVGYRAKQKLAEIKHEYGIEDGPAALKAPSINFPPPQGSGCPILDGQEASRILRVAIARVEHVPNGQDNSEECQYWISAAERKRLINSEIASGIGAVSSKSGDGSLTGAENVISGALGAVIEAHGDNKDTDPALLLQVWHSNGRAMWDKLKSANDSAKAATGLDIGFLGVTAVPGVGDQAAILPGGHSIMVLNGDSLLLLGFQQFAPGREMTTALARAATAHF